MRGSEAGFACDGIADKAAKIMMAARAGEAVTFMISP